MSQDQAEQNIQMWKVKKLIKSLDSARGCAPPLLADGLPRCSIRIHLQQWDLYDQSDYTSKSNYCNTGGQSTLQL